MADFWRNKKVFVPGGCGFIGSHVCERLVKLGAIVTVPVRQNTDASNLDSVKASVNLLSLSLEDESLAAAVLKGTDVVFYLATHTGGVHYSSTRHAEMFYNNLRPFLSTLEAARKASVKKFLLTSSACVYPDDAPSPVRESFGFTGMPQKSNEGYGMAKRAEEYGCNIYAKDYGMDTVVVRLFNTYGPRGHFDPADALVIPSLIRKILSAKDSVEVWGTGQAVRPFLYIDDCVDALLLAAEKLPSQTPINLAPRQGTSVKELAETLLEISGRKNLKIEYNTQQPEGQLNRVADVSLAAELLGFNSKIPLREGLKKTLDWFNAELESGRQKL